jgi:hypothetical protein
MEPLPGWFDRLASVRAWPVFLEESVNPANDPAAA